ncbi:MAG TPA: Ig-like domain-containing protein [Gemmatimonadales bacterium]|nr:Ig-like domain-containing protein [Gemmatimonadales bacterium]
MAAITLSRLVTAAALVVASACSEPFAPPPNEPSGASGLTVVPSSATIVAGQVVALKASMRDQFGDPLLVTVAWRSSDETVATVAATGEVLGRSAGTATIIADAGGKTQTSAIHVLRRLPKPDPDPAN